MLSSPYTKRALDFRNKNFTLRRLNIMKHNANFIFNNLINILFFHTTYSKKNRKKYNEKGFFIEHTFDFNYGTTNYKILQTFKEIDGKGIYSIQYFENGIYIPHNIRFVYHLLKGIPNLSNDYNNWEVLAYD